MFEYTNRTALVGGIVLRTIEPGVTLADLSKEAEVGIPASLGAFQAMSAVEPAGSTRVASLMTSSSFVPNCVLFESGGDFVSSAAESNIFPLIVSPGT